VDVVGLELYAEATKMFGAFGWTLIPTVVDWPDQGAFAKSQHNRGEDIAQA
jgi:hypothetical protein